ncbi:STAS domain-containing protein [Terriglobus aquaticus]|uniref:STAS domain-containing protein n=1 Tax=Terriglobus aquaticus TaxID=940139 RepID=A0ABW9KEX0_9BACT|nr:STAS domain-containing protein [Terriglobus aquaticus]
MQATTKVAQHTLDTSSGEPVVVLSFSGDISSTSKDAIMGAYHGISDSVHRVLLDYTNVEYINSSGISIIIQLLLEAKKSGSRKIGMYGLSAHFTKVFTMVGVTKYATLSADRDTALASL